MEGKANREKPNDEQGIGHGNKELIGYQEYWASNGVTKAETNLLMSDDSREWRKQRGKNELLGKEKRKQKKERKGMVQVFWDFGLLDFRIQKIIVSLEQREKRSKKGF